MKLVFKLIFLCSLSVSSQNFTENNKKVNSIIKLTKTLPNDSNEADNTIRLAISSNI